MGHKARTRMAVGAASAALMLLAGTLMVTGSACGSLLGVSATFVDGSPNEAAHDAASRDVARRDVTSRPADGATRDVVVRPDASSDTSVDGRTGPTDAPIDRGIVDSGTVDSGPRCAPDASFVADPVNCGRCGHGCLGARCVASACEPTPVAVATGTPNFLVVVDGNVYWTQQNPDALVTAVASGGNAHTLQLLGGNAYGIDTDGKLLYWLETNSGVYACPLGGCGDAAAEVLVDDNNLTSFLVTARTVYVTIPPYQVAACPRTPPDGGGTGCVWINQNQNYPVSPQVDDGGLVWGNAGLGLKNGSIVTCPAEGVCAVPTPLQPALAAVNFVAIDKAHVFWTEVTELVASQPFGRVMECQRDNCELNAAPYAMNVAGPAGIVSDGTRVYWAAENAPAVLSCPIEGCPDGGPTVLAGDAATGGAPFQIALDDAAVYWSNNVSDGLIMRVAKP